jgi:membrane-associated protease RseP (regulator of RpoE activity)
VAPWYTDWAIWRGGLGFSAALLGILMAHEMGHWLTARWYRIPVSFPMFIPFLPPLGTMGAVIAMQPRPMSSRAMMRIAAFGPFAGMVVAVPVYLLGLSWSEIRVLPGEGAQIMFLGTGLLNRVLDAWMIGPIPAGHDVFLHPVAFAGWAGFYVTAFNLTPLGQLDGGHITYGLFGERFNQVVPWVAAALIGVGAIWQNPMWLIMVALVAWTMGLRHPPLVTDGVARGMDRWIGIIAWVVLVLTFVPSPTLPG